MSRYNTSTCLTFDDFKDGRVIEKKLSISLSGDNDEVECDMSGRLNRYVPATRLDPAEGGDLEDFEVRYGKIDLTSHLTTEAEDRLKELFTEEAREDAGGER